MNDSVSVAAKIGIRVILGFAIVGLLILGGTTVYAKYNVTTSTTVSAEMLSRHTDTKLVGKTTVTTYNVDIGYEDLVCTINDAQLYDAFVKGNKVSAYVWTYRNGTKQLTLQETP